MFYNFSLCNRIVDNRSVLYVERGPRHTGTCSSVTRWCIYDIGVHIAHHPRLKFLSYFNINYCTRNNYINPFLINFTNVIEFPSLLPSSFFLLINFRNLILFPACKVIENQIVLWSPHAKKGKIKLKGLVTYYKCKGAHFYKFNAVKNLKQITSLNFTENPLFILKILFNIWSVYWEKDSSFIVLIALLICKLSKEIYIQFF